MLPLGPVRGELRVQRPAWHAAVRQVLGRQMVCAWGPLRWHTAGRDALLLVDHLQAAPQVPRGDQQSPRGGWCVVVRAQTPQTTPGELISNLQVRPGQQAVVVILPAAGDAAVQAFWTDGEVVHPLESLVVVGSGMLPLRPRVDALIADAAENDRPSRETLARHSRTAGGLGDGLFQRLKSQTITIVGLGRLGWQVAFGLAGLAIGQLRLIDADVVGPENLDAMPGLVEGDVGRRKIEVAAERLTQFQPGLVVQGVGEGILEAGGRQLAERRCDLLISAVDDDAARLAVSLLAAETLTPHLDLASSLQRETGGWISRQGDCRLLLPGRGCVACVGGLADREGVLERLRAPVGSLRRGRPPAWNIERAGSLGYWNGVVAGSGLELYLGLLRAEHDSFWQRLWWRPGEGLESRGSLVDRGGDCVFCGRWRGAVES